MTVIESKSVKTSKNDADEYLHFHKFITSLSVYIANRATCHNFSVFSFYPHRNSVSKYKPMLWSAIIFNEFDKHPIANPFNLLQNVQARQNLRLVNDLYKFVVRTRNCSLRECVNNA